MEWKEEGRGVGPWKGEEGARVASCCLIAGIGTAAATLVPMEMGGDKCRGQRQESLCSGRKMRHTRAVGITSVGLVPRSGVMGTRETRR